MTADADDEFSIKLRTIIDAEDEDGDGELYVNLYDLLSIIAACDVKHGSDTDRILSDVVEILNNVDDVGGLKGDKRTLH